MARSGTLKPDGLGPREHLFEQLTALLHWQHETVPDRVLGVRRAAVITLAVVLDRELPVALDRVVLPVRDPRALETVGREQRTQIVLDRVEGHGVLVEVDEDQALEDAQRQALEPQARLVETLGRVPRPAQRAVERVGPAMVLAGQTRLAALERVADARAVLRSGS